MCHLLSPPSAAMLFPLPVLPFPLSFLRLPTQNNSHPSFRSQVSPLRRLHRPLASHLNGVPSSVLTQTPQLSLLIITRYYTCLVVCPSPPPAGRLNAVSMRIRTRKRPAFATDGPQRPDTGWRVGVASSSLHEVKRGEVAVWAACFPSI